MLETTGFAVIFRCWTF